MKKQLIPDFFLRNHIDVFKIQIDRLGEISVKRSKRRSISISIKGKNDIRVNAPNRMSQKDIRNYIVDRRGWIEKNLKLMAQRKELPDAFGLEEDQYIAACQSIADRLQVLAEKHHLIYNGLTIRSQKTIWGSCSSLRRISLNFKIAFLPEQLRDYVILHELLHTRIRQHSSLFWRELDKLTGNSRALDKELNEYCL